MTNGSARPAGDLPSASSTTPTAGQPSEPSTTDETFPVTPESLSGALEEMFKQGWRAARLLPLMKEPLDISVTAKVNRETSEVDLEVQIQ